MERVCFRKTNPSPILSSIRSQKIPNPNSIWSEYTELLLRSEHSGCIFEPFVFKSMFWNCNAFVLCQISALFANGGVIMWISSGEIDASPQSLALVATDRLDLSVEKDMIPLDAYYCRFGVRETSGTRFYSINRPMSVLWLSINTYVFPGFQISTLKLQG